jgi:hypothetical protein
MLIVLRRCLILAAFAFWQGGFTFYAAVVVPVGTEVLGSSLDQGFITRRVTIYLNLTGGIALLLFALDNIFQRDPMRVRGLCRWSTWLGMAFALGILVWLHPRMDQLLQSGFSADVEIRFRNLHRWYLWISTVQWGLGVVYLLITVWSWRAADGRHS